MAHRLVIAECAVHLNRAAVVSNCAFMAMRLGSIKFVLPFIMVLTPALIMRGEPLEIVISIVTCTIAVIIMAMGFEGYLYGVGRITLEFWRGDPQRGLYFDGLLSTSQLISIAGVLLGAVMLLRGHRRQRVAAA